jgi:hypothetical protein
MAGVCSAWHGDSSTDKPRDSRHSHFALPITRPAAHPTVLLHTQPFRLFFLVYDFPDGPITYYDDCAFMAAFSKQSASAYYSSPSNHALILHNTYYGVYMLTAIGRYGIAGLKELARSKFAEEVELHLSSAEFPEACQEAYESTFHTDRGLRDVIIQTFRANPSLSLRSDVEMAVRETPGLAFELFRMASGLPIYS